MELEQLTHDEMAAIDGSNILGSVLHAVGSFLTGWDSDNTGWMDAIGRAFEAAGEVIGY